MNTLSWFIYLADIVDGIKGFVTGFVGVILVLFFILLCILQFIMALNKQSGSYREEKGNSVYKENLMCTDLNKFCLRIWFITLFFGVFITLVPQKTTLYAIAASEAGEMVVTSEEGKEFLSDVKQYLKHQLKVEE